MSTATMALNIGIVAALLGDTDLMTDLGAPNVFSLRAPENVAGDYITLGNSAEDQVNRFGAPKGNSNSEMIHIWGRDPNGDMSKERVLRHYGHVDRILNGRRLVLDGFTFVGNTRIITVLPDPDGRTIHLVALYDGIAI